MERAEKYRLEARKCLALLDLISDEGIKTELRKMATEWLAMADRANPKKDGSF